MANGHPTGPGRHRIPGHPTGPGRHRTQPRPHPTGPGRHRNPPPVSQPPPAHETPEPGPFEYDNPPPPWWAPAITVTGLPPLVYGPPPEPQDFTQSGTSEAKPIPIPYGRVMIQPMFLFGPRVYGSRLVTSWLCCVGGDDGIEGFEEIYLSGFEGPAWSGGTHGEARVINKPSGSEHCTVVQWHGLKNQPADPLIVNFEPTYADTNVYNLRGYDIGEVYITTSQPALQAEGPTTPTVIVKGLKCFDQRLSGGTGGFAYTTNPALWLADFINQPYGCDAAVDWDSVSVVADRNDEDIGGQPRRWGGALLNQDLGVEQHITRLRGIAGCSVRVQGSTFYFDAYAPRPSVFTFDVTNIVKGSFRPRYTDVQNQPTRVEVTYTATEDTSGNPLFPWTTRKAIFDDGTQPGSTSVVSFLDAQSHEVAYRHAIERYREKRFIPWGADFQTADMAADLYEGETVTVTHPDFDDVPTLMTIERIATRRDDKGTVWEISVREYDEALFSDDDVPDTPFGAPDAADPTDPPAVTGLSALDEVPQTGTYAGSLVIRISFRFPEWPFWAGARVRVIGEQDVLGGRNNIVYEDIVSYSGEDNVEVVTVPVSGTGDYRIQVWSRSTVGSEREPPEELVYTPRGKAIPPHDLLRLRAEAIGGEVELEAIYSVDEFDQLGFRFRRSAPGITGQAWDQMIPILNQARGSQNFTNSVIRVATPGEAQAGQFIEFAGKKVDTGRRESLNEQRAQVLLGEGQVQPATTFESWPRESDWTLNYSLSTFQSDALQPGDGWFFHSEGPDMTMTARYGNGSPAANPDKPHHYNNQFPFAGPDILMRSNPDDSRFADERVREMAWQMRIEEWDQDANPLPEVNQVRRLDLVYENDLGTGAASGTNSVISATEAMEANIVVPNIAILSHYTVMAQAPFVLTGRRTVLEQNGEVSALRDSYPQAITFGNLPTDDGRLYVETPIVTATVTTGNAVVAIQDSTNEGFTIVIITGPGTNETVTVQWNARGGAGG